MINSVRIIFLVSLIILFNDSFAQKKLLDSLKKAYAVEKSDQKKTQILTDICYKYFDTQNHGTNFDSLIKYFNLVNIVCHKSFDVGDSILLYGKIVNKIKSDSVEQKLRHKESIEYYKRSIPYHVKSGQISKVGEAYMQIAMTMKAIENGLSIKNASQIIPYYNKSLSAFEKAKDTKNVLGVYLELQQVYQEIGNYYFADMYLEKAFELSKTVNSDYEKAYVLCIYSKNQAVKAIDNKDFDIIKTKTILTKDKLILLESAVEKTKASIPLWLKLNSINGYMYALNDLAYYYSYLQMKDSALNYSFALLNYLRKKNLKQQMASVYGTCGDVYHSFKDYDMALKYMDSCYFISSEIGEVYHIKDLAANYAKIYSIKSDYEKAFKFQQLFIHLNDSLTAEEMKSSTAELQTKYETEKKEGQITSLNQENKIKEAENKRQRLFTYGSIGVGIIILFFALFIYRSLQQNKKKSKIIAQQKLIVEEQKHIVEEKHKEITDSINYAERIQRALLASKQSLNENLSDYFILFKPKDVVSGDFYWSSKLANGNFVLVTADSTGHGVPGAIMSMLNMNSLKEAITSGLTEADDILNYTRKIIINTLANDGSKEGGKDGMDCSLLIFDSNTLTLNWVAANNPVWVVRNAGESNSELIELKPQKMPVGKHDRQNEPFVKQTLQLQKNDLVYAITDGFPDQFGGEKGKKFMSKNLKELIQSKAHLTMTEQKLLLDKTFEEWVGNLEQIDDVTVIGIKI